MSTVLRARARFVVLVSLFTFAATYVVGFEPATAGTGSPAGSSDCSLVATHSKPTSTTVKVTWKATCKYGMSLINHGMTLSRSGKSTTAYKTCASQQGNITTCTGTITITNDPTGSQTYTAIDEWGYGTSACACSTNQNKNQIINFTA